MAALVAPLLSACEFEPVHRQGGPASVSELSKIEIGVIANRTGQLLREELLYRFRSGSRGTPKPYSLVVSVTEEIEGLGVRFDAVPTRGDLTLTADFKVIDTASGEVRFEGRSRAVSNYDILGANYATASAQVGARSRSVQVLADEIKERVSVWLLRGAQETARNTP